MKTKNKVLVGGGIFFVVMLVGVGIYDETICNPEWKTIQENLEYIEQRNAVKKIELYRAYDYPSTNLVRDTIEISDSCVIESIQMMINNRYKGNWNHPAQSWSVRMKLTLDNGRIIDIKVSKITNDKLPNMTHLYFGFKECPDNLPYCSDTLGNLLEQLTAYHGVNF